MPINRGLLFSFSNFFDEEGLDKYEYLEMLPNIDLRSSGAFLVNITKATSPFFEPVYLLGRFFGQENNELANAINNKIVELSQNFSEILILHPLSSLQIAEYSLETSSEPKTSITNSEFERALFKSYLKFNSDNDRDSKIIKLIEDFTNDDKWAAYNILNSLSYYDLINYDIYEVVVSQFIKALYLFEFMESTSEFQLILQEFLKEYSCKSWIEYLEKLLPLAFEPVLKSNKFTYTDHTVQGGVQHVEFCSFIDKLTYDIDNEFSRNYDFLKLRGYPLYKIEEGKYRVISDLFLAEKLYNSLYFSFAEINKKLGVKGVSGFRGQFCDKFTENYLFYASLRNIYEDKYIQLSGSQIKALYNIDSEPDYYIRNGNKIFLFESKDVLLNAEVKVSYDFKMIEEALIEKFYYETKKGKKSNKAVLQLINNIENILSENLIFDKSIKVKTARIYPILVTYYNTFNTPGINYWVNKWHIEELEKLSAKGLNVKSVKPLTIISIDVFLVYSDFIKAKKINLDEVIDAYHKLSILKPRKKVSLKKLKKMYMEQFIPFDVFIHDYCGKKGLTARPSLFLEKTTKMIQRT